MQPTDMSAAFLLSIAMAVLIPVLISIFLPFIMMSGDRWRAAEERARARRLVDAKMNARLLRFNL